MKTRLKVTLFFYISMLLISNLSYGQDLKIEGKAGIGTTNPDAKLSIKNIGELDGEKIISFGENEASQWWFGSGFAGTGIDDYVAFSNPNIADIMTWRANGNVGIGITDPQATRSHSMFQNA